MDQELRKKLLGRTKRAQGQLAAVQRMLETDGDCSEVLLQLAAVKGALGRIGEMLLRSHIETCVRDTVQSGDLSEREAVMDDLIAVFARYGGMGSK